MRKVSDSTRPSSRSSGTGESPNTGDGSEAFAHIKSANRKVRLIDILRHYGIKVEKNYQRPAWSNNIICPLPSHKGSKERTPSFGYCFLTDHFTCLGCGKSGRSVEFISLYEGVSRTEVAEKILAQYGEDISEEDNDYVEEISPILFDCSKHLQKAIQGNKNNPEKLKEIERLIRWFDLYLMNKATGNHILPEELQHRVDKIKELI